MMLVVWILSMLALTLSLINKITVGNLETEKALKKSDEELLSSRIKELNAKLITLMNIVAELENKVSAFEKGNTIIHVPVKVAKKPRVTVKK